METIRKKLGSEGKEEQECSSRSVLVTGGESVSQLNPEKLLPSM